VRHWRRRLSGGLAVASHLAREFPCPPLSEGATPTWRRLRNLWLLTRENYRIEPVPRSVPARLCIESTSACNLKCPHCFTGAGEVGRPAATLSLSFYRRLLAELGDRLWQIEFHNWGEPLLNKNLFTMVAEATAQGLSTSLCTNFSLPFDAARAEDLVRSGLKIMGVSIDAAGIRRRTSSTVCVASSTGFSRTVAWSSRRGAACGSGHRGSSGGSTCSPTTCTTWKPRGGRRTTSAWSFTSRAGGSSVPTGIRTSA
jgi:hypothetical protein